MKYIFNFLVLFLMFQVVVSQDNDINITVHQMENDLVFYALNNTESRQEIDLTISVKNLSGYQGPITKMVSAMDSIQMATLSIEENGPWSYETSYTYRPKPTDEEINIQNQKLKAQLFELLDTKSHPVIVFYGEGCTRSAYAKQMLEQKKIPFTYLNTTKDEHYNKVMFELLKMQEPDIKRVQFPVFLVDGRLDHDIENLRWYIKELASSKEQQ